MDCGIELGTIFGWLFVSNSELLLATAVVTRRTGISIACIHFSRAFHRVCLTHVKLFARLHNYGIQSDLLRWLRVFHTTHASNSSQLI